MNKGSLWIGVFGCLLSLAIPATAQKIQTVDVPNSTGTIAAAINLRGAISGYYLGLSDPNVDYPQGFLREPDGTIKKFGVQIGGHTFGTLANDMNIFGEVVGSFYTPPEYSGFLRRPDGTLVLFNGSGTAAASAVLTEPSPQTNCVDGTAAIAVNALGQITGTFGQGCMLGFLREANGTTTTFQVGEGNLLSERTVPQAINLAGQIAGYYMDPNSSGFAGFLRAKDGTVVRFKVPGSAQTMALGMNLLGQIVGDYDGHGFVRQPNGSIITFDPPGSVGTQPMAINLVGQVTGFFATADGVDHGFVRLSNGKIEVFDAPNALGTYPRDLNDLGKIAGYYEDVNSVLHGFIRTP